MKLQLMKRHPRRVRAEDVDDRAEACHDGELDDTRLDDTRESLSAMTTTLNEASNNVSGEEMRLLRGLALIALPGGCAERVLGPNAGGAKMPP